MDIKKVKWILGVITLTFLVGGWSFGDKTKTILVDLWLMEKPGEAKPKYVPNSKLKRGEYVKKEDEREVNGVKYFLVQIEGVDTKGWVDGRNIKDGKLKTLYVIVDADLYMRPNKKSDKTGRVLSGQAVFEIEEKDEFVLINYPGKEAYVLKSNLGSSKQVVKTVTFPGLGTATVTASSQYSFGEGRELEFDPRNLFDANLQTAWCEGKAGDDGIGESVTLTFPKCVGISEIGIVNGWAKSEGLYKQNGRIAEIAVEYNVGNCEMNSPVRTQNFTLSDDNYDYQSNASLNLLGTTFRFIISKVHKGKDPDTCMSEIKLTGTQSPY